MTRWDAVGFALALMALLFAITEHDPSWLTPGVLLAVSVGFRIWSRSLRDKDGRGGGMPPPAV